MEIACISTYVAGIPELIESGEQGSARTSFIRPGTDRSNGFHCLPIMTGGG